jgi:hypothetical protein
MKPDQFRNHRGKSIIVTLCPAVFERHVSAVDVAGFAQALAERGDKVLEQRGRCAIDVPDHWQRLLRTRH